MSTISDLAVLLREMKPERRPGSWVFVSGEDIPSGVTIEASVREREGLSVVIAKREADRLGFPYRFTAAWLTLTVSSALDAVGLTAAVSVALAEAGISCNVIAGLHHDHLLVPEERAADAITVLHALSAKGA